MDKFHQIRERVCKALEGTDFDLTEKSTIISDYNALITFIGDSGLPVSGRVRQFKSRDLKRINTRLVMPINIKINRPTFHSYPNVSGLYSLIRDTGLACYTEVDGKKVLSLDQQKKEGWGVLTGAEQYRFLLLTWAENRFNGYQKRNPSGQNLFDIWAGLFHNIGSGEYVIKRDPARENAVLRNPGMDNLSLMGMFGMLMIKQREPELVESWIPESVSRTRLGKTLMNAFSG